MEMKESSDACSFYALWLLSFVTEGAMGAELTRHELVSIIYGAYYILKGDREIYRMVSRACKTGKFTQLTDDLREKWGRSRGNNRRQWE